jgi:hypothetical protein
MENGRITFFVDMENIPTATEKSGAARFQRQEDLPFLPLIYK